MASKFQLRRLKEALDYCGPDATSQELFLWLEANYKVHGLRSAQAVSRLRPQVQEGWVSPRVEYYRVRYELKKLI